MKPHCDYCGESTNHEPISLELKIFHNTVYQIRRSYCSPFCIVEDLRFEDKGLRKVLDGITGREIQK